MLQSHLTQNIFFLILINVHNHTDFFIDVYESSNYFYEIAEALYILFSSLKKHMFSIKKAGCFNQITIFNASTHLWHERLKVYSTKSRQHVSQYV